jgi:hypothetical protein
MVFKQNLTPIGKGSITKHKGKGSQMADMPNKQAVSQLAQPTGNTMNNYAKATPLASPSAPPTGGTPDGIGSGSWPGIGQ